MEAYRERRLVAKRVVVVVLVVVVASVSLSLAYVAGRLDQPPGAPQRGQQLVSSGVQSVTICEEHHFRVLDRLTREIPSSDVGVWGPAKRGHCTTWYHYAEGEE